ncbi:MAG: Ppx/GppA family phosphatase [Ignavibacteriae bacterium]|nr:Ppx/GppA family phosphatase [Ignavibacteriota bacterium]
MACYRGEKGTMRIASIDIGTNTILLLVAEIRNNGELHALHHEQRFPRIGKSVNENRFLQQHAFDDATEILLKYKEIAERFAVDKIVACATSAVRDSQNQKEFVEYLHHKTEIYPEILSGDDEAILTYKGAVSGLPKISLPYLVIDIGGGSTEISYQKTTSLPHRLFHHSLDIGSVRITERYFHRDPPLVIEIIGAKMFIENRFHHLQNQLPEEFELVGVAGTVTTLACLDQHMLEFHAEKIRGLRMSTNSIQNWKDKLLCYSSTEIHSLSRATEGREDILSAGALILFEFMRFSKSKSIVVSERGLRYGLALREWEKENS